MMAIIGQDELSKVSTKLERFIVSCKHERTDCHFQTTFSQKFTPKFFNCFTYTAPNLKLQKHNKKYPPKKEGIEDGWSAIVLAGNGVLGKLTVNEIDRGTDNITPFFDKDVLDSGSEGVRVVIHPPDTEAFPSKEGYDVPPGHSASFALKYRINKKMGLPYGNCTKQNPFGNLNETHYRQISCNKMCFQLNILRSCGCVVSYLTEIREYCANASMQKNNQLISEACKNFTSTANSQSEINHITLCGSQEMDFNQKMSCMRRIKGDSYNDFSIFATCGCYEPCEQFEYDVSYSLAKWPATNLEGISVFNHIYYESFLYRICRYESRHLSNNEYQDLIVKLKIIKQYLKEHPAEALADFSRINVFLSDGNIVKMVESADYQWFQLLSDIGGQIGIWIGVSVISVSEVFEMAFLIVRDALFGPCKRKKTRVDKEAGNNGDNGEQEDTKKNIRKSKLMKNVGKPVFWRINRKPPKRSRIDAQEICSKTDSGEKCSQTDVQEICSKTDAGEKFSQIDAQRYVPKPIMGRNFCKPMPRRYVPKPMLWRNFCKQMPRRYVPKSMLGRHFRKPMPMRNV